MFRYYIGHNIAKNFAIWLDRLVPADLQREVNQIQKVAKMAKTYPKYQITSKIARMIEK